MQKLTKEDLIQTGYTEEVAKAIMALTPIQRIRRIGIVGNAFSDMPLFQTVNEVLVDETATMFEKWEAVVKSWRCTGSDSEAEFPKTQEAQQQLVEKWVEQAKKK